jgi:quinol monooxygenase YgiN
MPSISILCLQSANKFLEAIAEDAAATRKEPGCLQFDVLVLANDPNHLFPYEVYESEAAFRAHRESDYFKICFNDRQHGRKARNTDDDGALVRTKAPLGALVRLGRWNLSGDGERVAGHASR